MASARPYRFPAPPGEDGPARCSTGESCGTCGASAAASCVALCCCPCAVVGCLTLALARAPYAAGRRCVAWLAKSQRKRKRVRSLDEQQYPQQAEGLGGAAPRASKDWGELGRAGADMGGDGCRVRVSATEKLWAEMYKVGHWGFGRLSFSAAGGEEARATEKDGVADVGQ